MSERTPAVSRAVSRAFSLGDFQHHMYGCYCKKDGDRVRPLLEYLSTIRRLKVVDPERDFKLGASKLDCMLTNGIEVCKVTMVFVTKKFLSDAMCMYQAKTAVWRAARTQGKHRVIPVMLDSVKLPKIFRSQGLNCVFAWKYKEDDQGLHERLYTAIIAPQMKYRRIKLVGLPAHNKVESRIPSSNIRLAMTLLFHASEVKDVLQNCVLHCNHGNCNFVCQGSQIFSFHKHLKECRFQEVTCGNPQCQIRLQRRHSQKHKERCKHKHVTCSHEGCRKEIEKCMIRLHEEKCPYKIVKCENERFGCEHVFCLKDSGKHMEICEFITDTCPDCDQVFVKKDAEEHRKQCIEANTQCPHCSRALKVRELPRHLEFCLKDTRCRNNGCLVVLKHYELLNHQVVCPYAMYRCQNIGCGFEDVKRSLQEHSLTCQYRSVQCGECGTWLPFKDLVRHTRECETMTWCEDCGLQVPSSSKITHRYVCTRQAFMAFCEVCKTFQPQRKWEEHKEALHGDNWATASYPPSAFGDSGFVGSMQTSERPRSKSDGSENSDMTGIPIPPRPIRNSSTAKMSLENTLMDVLYPGSSPNSQYPESFSPRSVPGEWKPSPGKHNFKSGFQKLKELYGLVDKNKNHIYKQLHQYR